MGWLDRKVHTFACYQRQAGVFWPCLAAVVLSEHRHGKRIEPAENAMLHVRMR